MPGPRRRRIRGVAIVSRVEPTGSAHSLCREPAGLPGAHASPLWQNAAQARHGRVCVDQADRELAVWPPEHGIGAINSFGAQGKGGPQGKSRPTRWIPFDFVASVLLFDFFKGPKILPVSLRPVARMVRRREFKPLPLFRVLIISRHQSTPQLWNARSTLCCAPG